MALRVRVEAVMPSRGIVFACPVEPGPMLATPRATLDGRRVAHFELPRKLRPDGTPDLELDRLLTRESRGRRALHRRRRSRLPRRVTRPPPRRVDRRAVSCGVTFHAHNTVPGVPDPVLVGRARAGRPTNQPHQPPSTAAKHVDLGDRPRHLLLDGRPHRRRARQALGRGERPVARAPRAHPARRPHQLRQRRLRRRAAAGCARTPS